MQILLSVSSPLIQELQRKRNEEKYPKLTIKNEQSTFKNQGEEFKNP